MGWRKQIALMPIAALVALTVGAGSSLATPIDYTVAGSATFGSVSETISGTFTYDPTTMIESSVDLTLTGGAPFAGTYVENTSALGNGTIISAPLSGFPAIDLIFANQLSDVPDTIAGVDVFLDASNRTDSTFASGTATPPLASVPEPATVAVFGLGLAGLGVIRRRKSA